MRDSLKAFVSSIESQRNRLAIILDSTTDSILAVDKDGHITTANKAAVELAGRPSHEIVGHPAREVFGFTSAAQPFTIDYSSAVGNTTYPNIEYLNNLGAKHYLRLIVAHLEGTDLRPRQSIITIRDETKSRELESMKLDFVSMAAHELRTPLAAIRGYIELISFKQKRAQPEIKNYLQQALKSTVELSSLINNLLDVSRIERGTLTLNMGKTDLAASMNRAIRDVNFQAVERGIELSYIGPSEEYLVNADEIALREVITNLLTNAIKYTAPGGKVKASLEAQDESYKVAVVDSGIGIPKSALPHLFTKFFRVHGGLDSGSSGTGLGLFISKSIIERHDGTIAAVSEEGRGSTFYFTIPKLSAGKLAQVEAQAQSEPTTAMRRHRGWVTKNTTR
jgi:PAS domain S-box-containing protein